MAGQSGHNLSISMFRRGCRLPCERYDAGDGYAGAGPVVTYRLSPEEIAARYGPPGKKKCELTRAAVKWAVEYAGSPAEAAEKLNITEKHLRFEMARHCVAVPGEWKEDEEMENTQENEYVAAITGAVKAAMEENGIGSGAPESTETGLISPGSDEKDEAKGLISAGEETPLKNDSSGPVDIIPEPDSENNAETPGEHGQETGNYAEKRRCCIASEKEGRPKTRREIFEKKLTKELYLQLKQEGLSDNAVLGRVGLPQWTDVLTRFKEKWGLRGLSKTAPAPTPEAAGQDQEKAAPARLTIAQALELRDELEEDLDSLEHLLECYKDSGLSVRVMAMLIWQAEEHRRCLERLKEVFNTATVAI